MTSRMGDGIGLSAGVSEGQSRLRVYPRDMMTGAKEHTRENPAGESPWDRSPWHRGTLRTTRSEQHARDPSIPLKGGPSWGGSCKPEGENPRLEARVGQNVNVFLVCETLRGA